MATTQELLDSLNQIETDLQMERLAAETPEAVLAVRNRYFGKDGKFKLYIQALGQLSLDDRRRIGLTLNEIFDRSSHLFS